MATDPGAGKDLRTYLSENAPLAPHRAALLVASLAEQMAAVHAGGRTYADVRAETVRVDADSARVTVDSPVVALGGVGSAANVRAAGALLALLLGGWPGGRRPNGVPAELWRLVDACAGVERGDLPGAAQLASRLRDVVRDLLLDTRPQRGAPAPVPGPPPPLPTAPTTAAPARPRDRMLLFGAAGLAVLIAVGGILLAAGGLRLPGPHDQVAARHQTAAPSPTGTATAEATPSPSDSAPVPGPATDPPSPPSTPEPVADVATTAPGPTPVASSSGTPTPPPGPPPTGEPSPSPGTTFKMSAYDVPSGHTTAPFVRGKLTWYNRSVGVSGVMTSTSDCAATVYTGYAGGSQVARYATPYKCGRVSISQTLDASTIRGGITQVYVDLYVDGTRIARESCMRSTDACTRA